MKTTIPISVMRWERVIAANLKSRYLKRSVRAIPILGRRLRPGDVLLGAAVLAVVIAVVVNGISQVRTNHGTKRDTANFKKFLSASVGSAGFGNPRVSLRPKVDTVCATHRRPDYRLCARIDAKTGHITSAYKLVPQAGGGTQRVNVSLDRAGSASAAPRSTQTG
jgi:hypothetical protein